MFIDFLKDESEDRFPSFYEKQKSTKIASSEESSTKGEGSLDSSAINNPRELQKLAARSKRAEVRSRLKRKWERKELEKQRELIEAPFETSNKKWDTVWKIIMPGKDRKLATYSEEKIVREIEDLIEKHPTV